MNTELKIVRDTLRRIVDDTFNYYSDKRASGRRIAFKIYCPHTHTPYTLKQALQSLRSRKISGWKFYESTDHLGRPVYGITKHIETIKPKKRKKNSVKMAL